MRAKLRVNLGPLLRQHLVEKFQNRCTSCGVTGDEVPLEIAHIIPLARGGLESEENFTLLCPNCHRTFDQGPREVEFVRFLANLLEASPEYSGVKIDVVTGRDLRYRADILADRKVNHGIEGVLVECKLRPIFTKAHALNVVEQLKKYKSTFSPDRLALAIPATLQDSEKELLKEHGIELWDIEYIANRFEEQLRKFSAGPYKQFYLSKVSRGSKLTREQELIALLKACPAGRKDWHVYQSLIGDVLECLFCPPLENPIPELSDKSKANRRDFILPNYSYEEFWRFLRERYFADYIVIDCKNYTGKAKKNDVLQVANYLKRHGAGLFGMIITRIGGDSAGCESSVREQWILHGKLVIILNDEDIEAMLLAKMDGRKPEDVISRKVEMLRLSM